MFVYYRVPSEQIGTTLYPLNELRAHYPALYERAVRKYTGREFLLRRHIPSLDCLWNDVLHCSPVPPEQIHAALREVGFQIPPTHWYKIDVVAAGFTAANTVIYESRASGEFTPDCFVPFEREKLMELSTLPSAALAYYREQYEGGKNPLLFHRIPHILYRGTLDTCALDVITI